MTEYNHNKDRLFVWYEDNSGILDKISSIRIELVTQSDRMSSSGSCESVIVKSLGIRNTGDVCDVTLYIDSPLTGINGLYTFTVMDKGKLYNKDIYSSVFIDLYEQADPGTYAVDANVRLRYIGIREVRYIRFSYTGCDCEYKMGIDLKDGHNVSIRYDESTGCLYIIGGPGQGLGKYSGKSDEVVYRYYSGIRSINGLRVGRNVNIDLSDTMIENGSRIYVE